MRDDEFDAYIAATEYGPRGESRDLAVMELEDRHLADAGLLDPDQPTPYSHHVYRARLFGEFTPDERARIRMALGMVDG